MTRRSLFPLITATAIFLPILAHAQGQATKVLIKEWDLPEAGTFPHDPLATPDGSLWYTGMNANLLGRLNLKTGQFKEYPLRIAGSGPHGLAADST